MTPSRGPRVGLIVIFLVLIGVVAPSQIVLELRQGETPGIADLFRQTPTRANLRRLESDLESKCRLAQAVRPSVQYARFVLLQDAGDKALLGRSGWFFYRPAVQYLVEREVSSLKFQVSSSSASHFKLHTSNSAPSPRTAPSTHCNGLEYLRTLGLHWRRGCGIMRNADAGENVAFV